MKDDPIQVKVVERSDRRYIVYRWSRPATGEQGERSARTAKRRQAYRGVPDFVKGLRAEFAAKEVANQPEAPKSTWEEACQRYEAEHLIKRRESTRAA